MKFLLISLLAVGSFSTFAGEVLCKGTGLFDRTVVMLSDDNIEGVSAKTDSLEKVRVLYKGQSYTFEKGDVQNNRYTRPDGLSIVSFVNTERRTNATVSFMGIPNRASRPTFSAQILFNKVQSSDGISKNLSCEFI